MLIGSVEQVDLVGIQSELNNILRTSGASGRYTSCHRNALACEVQICLGTEHFCYVNSSLDHAVVLSVGDEHILIVDVLGTDTKDNILVNVVLESVVVSLSCGKLNVELAASGGLGVLGRARWLAGIW